MPRILLLLTLLLAGAFAQAQALRVGMSPDYPPLAYRDEGRVVGVEADNVRALSQVLGREMQIVELPFEKLIPALRAGEIDVIMSGMSVTQGRAEQVLFTEPYMVIGQMAILHRDKVGTFGQPWAMYQEGVRIGVEPGTTGAAFAEEELPDAKLLFFDDPQAAFEGLRAGEIDLYIHDAPTSWQLATSMEQGDLISLYQPLTNEELAWAVRPDDAALAGLLNDGLARMKSSGTLRYILNRWIPVTVEVR